jgi:hypothetical protein
MSRAKLAIGLTLSCRLAMAAALWGQTALPEWTVEAAPVLRVGIVEGLDSDMFVRVVDAASIPDGGVVVLDAGATEIRFYDAEGHFTATAGRAGEGPGEFLAPFALEVRSDSVLVWDYRRRAIIAWSFAGELLGERSVPHHPTIHEGDLLPDGSLIIPRYRETSPSDRPASGTYRAPAELVRYSDGDVQELGSFPWMETQVGSMGVPVPFGARSSAAGGGVPIRIFVTDDTNRPLVREYDGAGSLVRTIELRDFRERLGRSEWAAIFDTLPTVRGREEAIRRIRAEMDLPDHMPWVERLMTDAEGRLWAISGDPAGRISALVYEGSVPIARVALPRVARLMEIGRDRIVALERDALDVETIVVYRYWGQ